MSRLLTLVLATAITFILSGCATDKPVGLIYTDVHGPQSATVAKPPTKVGEACAMSILSLFATGDASIDAARKAGGITVISSVDTSAWSVLGVYGKYCTIVKGQ